MHRNIAKILLTLIIATCGFFALGSSESPYTTSTLSTPNIAYAEDDTPTRKFVPAVIPKATNLPGPDTDTDKSNRKILGETVLPKIAVFIIGFVGGLSILFLVIGGVRFAMAYGNEEDITNAKNQVVYAIVGLLISLLSYAIVAIIINLKFEGNVPIAPPASEQNPAPEPAK